MMNLIVAAAAAATELALITKCQPIKQTSVIVNYTVIHHQLNPVIQKSLMHTLCVSAAGGTSIKPENNDQQTRIIAVVNSTFN